MAQWNTVLLEHIHCSNAELQNRGFNAWSCTKLHLTKNLITSSRTVMLIAMYLDVTDINEGKR